MKWTRKQVGDAAAMGLLCIGWTLCFAWLFGIMWRWDPPRLRGWVDVVWFGVCVFCWIFHAAIPWIFWMKGWG